MVLYNMVMGEIHCIDICFAPKLSLPGRMILDAKRTTMSYLYNNSNGKVKGDAELSGKK